jgi:hypothetical protein
MALLRTTIVLLGAAALLVGSAAFAQTTAGSDHAPASCPITRPPNPAFLPPPPYPVTPDDEGRLWFGTNELWTVLQAEGVWPALPRNRYGYRQKIAWWHQGLDWRVQPYPDFVITVKRLDGPTPAGLNFRGNVSFGEEWNSFFMSAVDLPTPGCWEITGHLPHYQELSFVVWVEP